MSMQQNILTQVKPTQTKIANIFFLLSLFSLLSLSQYIYLYTHIYEAEVVTIF